MLLDRRRLLLLALSVAAGGTSCSGDDYRKADEERLERQRREETQRSGRGPYGALRFRGYRGLARLPGFELDAQGRLRLALEPPPRGIDVHTHLGTWALFAPPLDLLRPTERVRYLLDCDGDVPGCELDLDVYLNTNFSPAALRELRGEVRRQLLRGGRAATTHTVPNLVGELDAMGFEHAAVLPIASGLPFSDDLTEHWMDAIEQASAGERLLPFASVHPRDSAWRKKLRRYAERGARGVKLHPELQRFFPDDPEALEVYEECERLGLPVIFHAGRSGIEPRFLRRYAMLRRYRRAVASFPRLPFVFGHAGARDVAEAVEVARAHGNVWLGIAGQGATQLHQLLEVLGPKRLVFGSDWPFYPLAATLAKVLIVTEGRPAARHAILRANAAELLGLSG